MGHARVVPRLLYVSIVCMGAGAALALVRLAVFAMSPPRGASSAGQSQGSAGYCGAAHSGGGRQARVSPFPRTELGAIPAFEPAEGLFPPLRSARRVLGRNGGSRLPRTCGSEMVKTCCALRRKGPQDAWTACKGCAPHQISGEEAKKAIVFALRGRRRWSSPSHAGTRGCGGGY